MCPGCRVQGSGGPSSHAHVNDPSVSVHAALLEQSSDPSARPHIRQSRHIQDSQGTYKTVKAHIRQSNHI